MERTFRRFAGRLENQEWIWVRVSPVPVTGCWLWTKAMGKKGYGLLAEPMPNGRFKMVSAHRYAYRTFRGEIPVGLTIDHLCRVKLCVNPWHMELVTNRENQLRGDGMGGANARKTHCPQGHLYSSDNTYSYVSGGKCRRICKTCHKAHLRRSYRRRISLAPQRNVCATLHP